jgi:hypothetical protein
MKKIKEELLKIVPKSPRTGMEIEGMIDFCDGFEECMRLMMNRIKRKKWGKHGKD